MVWRKLLGIKEDNGVDIDRYMNNLATGNIEEPESENVTYVKPIDINGGGDISPIISEINNGNIVVLDLKPVIPDKTLLRNVIRELQEKCNEIDCDMARISAEKILVVPPGTKIIHRG